jgi:uncharacterized protein
MDKPRYEKDMDVYSDDFDEKVPASGKEAKEQLPPIEISVEALSPEALAGIIDNFIVREGTDYGAVEVDHETKIERIRRQMAKGDIVITFDPNTESVSLLTRREWQKFANLRPSNTLET